MLVKATRNGYYNHVRVKEGESFHLLKNKLGEDGYSKKWMEKIGPKVEEITEEIIDFDSPKPSKKSKASKSDVI